MKTNDCGINMSICAVLAGTLWVPSAAACGIPAQLAASFSIQQLEADPWNPLEPLG